MPPPVTGGGIVVTHYDLSGAMSLTTLSLYFGRQVCFRARVADVEHHLQIALQANGELFVFGCDRDKSHVTLSCLVVSIAGHGTPDSDPEPLKRGRNSV